MNHEARAADAPADSGHPLMAEAVSLHTGGRLDEAADAYRTILKELPQDFDATHLLGVVALQQGRFDIAQRLISAALAISPHDAAAMGNLGTSYMRDGQLEAALQWFDIALKVKPDSSVALANVGTALHNLGRYREALPIMRRAFAADPGSYTILNLLGACLIKTGEPREAIDLFDAATRAEPDNAEGWANLSVALSATGQHGRARECADKAVALRPNSSTALGALGAAQYEQGRLAEAIESYRQGVALAGPSAEMLMAFGNALLAGGLNEEAIEQLQRAIELDPKNLKARWAIALAHLKPIAADPPAVIESRRKFAAAVGEVAAWYEATPGVHEPYNAVGALQPFYLAYHPFNNRDLLAAYGSVCARWMTTLPIDAANAGPVESGAVDAGAVDAGAAARGPRGVGGKIRLGIASAQIHEHSVWNAITRGWVHNLDKERFEIHLFQLNPTSDQETERARRTVAYFEDRPTTLSAWAQAIKAANLDILIYPEIGMNPLTVQLASLRLAPVQAATWGHPETTGLPTMDLYLSAEALEPANSALNYTERLVQLPNLGVYVEPLAPKIGNPKLDALKIPDDEPLLLCPGVPFKYSPYYDDVWPQIAKHLRKRWFKRGGGHLVFFRSRSDTMDRMLETRLRAAFARADVRFEEHASIIPSLDRSRFFGLMQKSALMLDTLGFSGFNTALQAIECDLPVLAFEGEFMRGRLASAIMRRLELPELIASTSEEFVSKAIELAGDANLRKRLRAKIIARRKILFHDLAPVRALEHRLTEAVERPANARADRRKTI
jgi:predicted O-linked N-acetylglucosamine transferase (SPINDLY family)